MSYKIAIYNYWAGAGYKYIFSKGISLDCERIFKKLRTSFPATDEIDINEEFKTIWIFQCSNHGAIFLGWIHSSGKLPGKNYSLPSYQSIILEGDITIDKIIEKLKRGPITLYGSKNSTTDFDTTENEEYFSDNENQFSINEKFIELLKSQKAKEELLRGWSETPTNFIAEEKKFDNSYGNWEMLSEKINQMNFDELKAGVKRVDIKERQPSNVIASSYNFRSWIKTIVIFSILGILSWTVWFCVKPSSDEKTEQKLPVIQSKEMKAEKNNNLQKEKIIEIKPATNNFENCSQSNKVTTLEKDKVDSLEK